ncbi:MAG: GntR family transcriptional regulator [candidate division NC10 bacterium]|nr:GntR family transcriptional regulator [candidate division NC10 bacterium]
MSKTELTERVNAIQSTASVIAQSLKEMIYEAELKPGQQLVQETIARMFQVSRIPVRDALQLLTQMGIAVNVPRKGVIVRPLSRKLLNELFELRTILEGAAVRIVVQRMSPERLQELNRLMKEQIKCLKAGDVKGQEKLDAAFHRTLYDYEAVGNSTLIDLIFANWDRIKQARCASTIVADHGKKWISGSIQRHKRVLDALRRRKEDLACRIIVENIESSRREITSSLEALGWIEPASGNSTIRDEEARWGGKSK